MLATLVLQRRRHFDLGAVPECPQQLQAGHTWQALHGVRSCISLQ